MIELRKPKGSGGIGGHGEPRSFKRTAFKCRKPLRKVSKKQRKRNKDLKSKLQEVLAVQHALYGTERCEAGFKGWKGSCFGDLVLDHVQTRQVENPDDFENLQVLCAAHNGLKGSVRGLDFRPEEMKQAMKELDSVS